VLGSELEKELEGFLLSQLPEGWKDDQGSWGEFTIDVAAGQLTAQANWRIDDVSHPQQTCWRWRN
jgi:hypothetical protein